MSKISFTENQQSAIDVDISNVLVSAAAGSGKTAVLSERVIRLLTKENPIDASRLVVVTFTVLAAGEMRSRISQKLSALIEKDPLNKHLQAQQLMLSNAKIRSIHSLCAGLVRDNFQKLGLSPDFRVADETELNIIKNDAVDQVFGEYYDNKDQRFIDLVEYVCVKNDSRLVDLTLSIYDFVRSFPFPKQFFADCINAYKTTTDIKRSIWYQGVYEHINDALNSSAALIDKALDQIGTVEQVKSAYSASLEYDKLQIQAILNKLNEDEWDDAVKLAGGFQKLRLSPCRGFEDKEFLDDVKSKRDQAHSILADVAQQYLLCSNEQFLEDVKKLTPIIEIMMECVSRVYDLIEQKKLEQAVIDYADLEHYTVKLLVKEGTFDEQSDIAIELCQSFDEIMVDECQDINEVQNLIFKLLSKQEHNIFMVGDVKQSIYRFRKAMPTLFIEKKNSFPKYNKSTHTGASQATITLEDNFRSRKQVCDTVNLFFGQIMSEHMGEIEYDKGEELVPSANYQQNDDAFSEIHIVDSSNDELKNIEVEANYIAKLIKQRVESGYMVEEAGEPRPCRYGDFAILLRAVKKKSEIYLDALKKQGIGGFCDSNEGYFNEYEIAVTLNLLRVIDNPLQDICLASVLMSPMFGFDADEISKIRLKKINVPLYLALLECANGGDIACADFVEAISLLRKKSTVCTIEELLTTIYEQTDFISLVYALGNGQQRDANLRLLLTYTSQYEGMGSCGLSGFLRYIDKVIKNKQDFSSANVLSKNTDTVKIMSIHSSKGLEFPICIVADCAKKFNTMDLNQSYLLNSKLTYGMKIVDKANLKKYTNLPFEAIRLATLKETISEEMRVLYVALTRAREKLIMVMTMASPEKKINSLISSLTDTKKLSPFAVFSAKSYADWILMSVLRFQDIHGMSLENVHQMQTDAQVKLIWYNAVTSQEPASDELTSELHTAKVDEKIKTELLNTFNYKYADEPLTKIEAKLTATTISKQDKSGVINLKVNPSFLQNMGLTPAMKGTILHSFMQYSDFENAEKNLDNELARLVSNEFLSKTQIDAIDKNAVSLFLKSSLYEKIKQADEVLREYKFLHFINAGDVYDDLDDQFKQEQILIQGIADCIVIKDSRATIIDYKTDRTNDEQVLVSRYKNQLAIYKSAIEQSLSIPVESCKIYSLYLNKEIEVAL